MLFTCACCGHKTLPDFPGSYDICPICFWEDDQIQLLDPWYEGGANRPCLHQAQMNYVEFGACEQVARSHVRSAQLSDERDTRWRQVTEIDKDFVKLPRDLTADQWGRLECWYYWLEG